MSDRSIDLSGIATGIPLLSFSMGDPRGGGVQFTRNVDSHTPALFQATTTGAHIAEAVLHSPAMTYHLTDCILSSYSLLQDEEHWTLSYTTIELAAADGTSVGYDVAQQTAHTEHQVEPPADTRYEPAPADDGVTEI